MRDAGRVAEPYCSSRASCSKLVAPEISSPVGEVRSLVAVLVAVTTAEVVPLDSVAFPGAAPSEGMSSLEPSSSPSYHIGRIIPVPGS